MVGKDIIHRFMNESNEDEELWDGRVTAFNNVTKKHTIAYTGDAEEYEYDLTADMNNGDIWVLS